MPKKNLVSKVLSLLSFPKHPLTRLGKLLLEGDSLWSAVARYRFGSHLRTLQASETKSPVGLAAHIRHRSQWTTKAVPSNTADKLSEVISRPGDLAKWHTARGSLKFL